MDELLNLLWGIIQNAQPAGGIPELGFRPDEVAPLPERFQGANPQLPKPQEENTLLQLLGGLVGGFLEPGMAGEVRSTKALLKELLGGSRSQKRVKEVLLQVAMRPDLEDVLNDLPHAGHQGLERVTRYLADEDYLPDIFGPEHRAAARRLRNKAEAVGASRPGILEIGALSGPLINQAQANAALERFIIEHLTGRNF